MPAVAVLSANLLFDELYTDTLTNPQHVPVRNHELAMAKVMLLFRLHISV